MKIDGYQVSKLYESFTGAGRKAAGAGHDSSPKDSVDRVEISSKAADMNTAVSLGSKITTQETSEARQARIDELKS